MRLVYIFLLFVITSVMVSCSNSDPVVTKEKVVSNAEGEALRERFASGYSYGKKGGAAKSQSEKTSDFAGKSFGGISDFSGKNYTGKTYSSERWGGGKSFLSKKYAGNKRSAYSDKVPDFAQKQIGNTQYASDSKKAGKYGKYGVDAAREVSKSSIDNKVNTYADKSKQKDILIVPWQNQNTYSIEQTKSFMGNGER